MKILFATAEALPYWKTGGLADVARSLPDALVARGHDVRIITPRYRFFNISADAPGRVRSEGAALVPWPGGDVVAEFTVHEPASGAGAVFVDGGDFFDTDRPYDPDPGDPLSLGRRFAFFCRAVVSYAGRWGADVVHLNDWPTGLVPVYGLTDGMQAATLFVIHNLAYQGNFPAALLPEVGVPPAFMRTENGLEFHQHLSFMKGGIALADRLVTVSPAYAAEIRTPAFGNGLHGLLTFRQRVLHGVLNGIDTTTWNPTSDPWLPATYNSRTLDRKEAARAALAENTGIRSDGPVLGVVSRLVHQKGVEILLGALPELVDQGCSVVILGNGDPELEYALARRAAQLPGRVSLHTGFNDGLAHLIYAGADFFLMPSIYEPCGLGQMIAQRYGTPPIARRTGGLADTIEDGVTGLLFDEPSPHALAGAVRRALGIWNQCGWRAMQSRCMREDHSWDRSAGEYVRLYEMALGSAFSGPPHGPPRT
ncbi:MAG TPA: glycogen synthase [Longimicrobiales bacterium]|nr:glycogen synthase [Longimicrobiales bacterium]